MIRKPVFHAVVFGVVVLAWMVVPVWAAAPDIQVSLNFTNKVGTIPTYLVGEAVGVSVVVSYGTGKPALYVSRGFQDPERRYYLEMRVKDPIGRVLISRSEVEHIESPDAPPLPWVVEGGESFQVTGCEVLCPGFYRESGTANLGQYYDISLPGYYSVQAQVSVTVFSGEPDSPCVSADAFSCEDAGYDFKGVLKSATRYFYVQGSSAGLQVVPNQWSTKWAASEQEVKQVQIHLQPEAGETTGDYLLETLQLNGVKPFRVEGLKPMIKAYFNAKELMGSLGPVAVGQSYTVYLSGQRKAGASYQFFGKTQTVRIVN